MVVHERLDAAGSAPPAAACLSIGPLLRRGPGSDKRGSVNLMPVGMAVGGDGSTVVQGRV